MDKHFISFLNLAMMCYAALAEYKKTIAQSVPLPAWDQQSDEFRNGFVDLVKTHYNRCVSGNNDPAMIHNQWMKMMIESGWIGGDEFSVDDKTNPAITPWNSLADSHKVKNYIIAGIIGGVHQASCLSKVVYVGDFVPKNDAQPEADAPEDSQGSPASE